MGRSRGTRDYGDRRKAGGCVCKGRVLRKQRSGLVSSEGPVLLVLQLLLLGCDPQANPPSHCTALPVHCCLMLPCAASVLRTCGAAALATGRRQRSSAVPLRHCQSLTFWATVSSSVPSVCRRSPHSPDYPVERSRPRRTLQQQRAPMSPFCTRSPGTVTSSSWVWTGGGP